MTLEERMRQQKRLAKLDKIQTLRALLEMWEARIDDVDPQYLTELRHRLRAVENQYAAMKP